MPLTLSNFRLVNFGDYRCFWSKWFCQCLMLDRACATELVPNLCGCVLVGAQGEPIPALCCLQNALYSTSLYSV